MPITLPNSGLVCPEVGDPNLEACRQLKELFTYVDTLPTSDDLIVNPCVDLVSINWVVQGDPTCKEFKQTISIPVGVNPYKSAITIVDDNGCVVNLCMEIVSVSSLCVITNTPGNYQITFG